MLNTLIVEDNTAHRQALHHLLESRFPAMRILEAADAEGAIQQTKAQRFDLVFVDIRLPGENGLNFTKTIKTTDSHAVVCIVTGYDILEYREAALRNGADLFVVKGESTEAEIVGMIEDLLHTRFISLILASDAQVRRQINLLLSIHWPAMIVAEAASSKVEYRHLAALNPNLVLLELDQDGTVDAEWVRQIRRCSPHATLIGIADDEFAPLCRARAHACGIDYCAPMSPFGHTELVGIVNSLQPQRKHH
jgi:DNA-binding NarL/FixJ family response regulator